MTELRTPPPASGAWRPGDPPGRRKFLRVATTRPFVLEGGGRLRDVVIAYETWGELAPEGDNAILVCHAWTGDSHVTGHPAPGHPTEGWWEGVVGPGCALDTERYFVVCANVVGGCQGSTGPSSPDPADPQGRPYGPRFPVITIRDMVRIQERLTTHLGIDRWLAIVGGSMGGMQVLEWGVMYPRRARGLIPIGTCAQATAQQIAWGSIGRKAIRLDPNFHGGDYYDEPRGAGPHAGLGVARMVAQVTFRSDDVFTDRFGRELADGHDGERGAAPLTLWQRFEVERYLEHHGDKLARRFDANSYLVIGKAMDLHDVARGRGGLEPALARITVPVLAMGIDSDVLYPTYQQHQIADVINATGGQCEYAEVHSPHGHDAFLIDTDQVGSHLRDFLDRLEKP